MSLFWTPEKDAILRRVEDGAPYRAVAMEIGCTTNAAIGRARRIGIASAPSDRLLAAQRRNDRASQVIRLTRPSPSKPLEPSSPPPAGDRVHFTDHTPQQCCWPLWGNEKVTMETMFFCARKRHKVRNPDGELHTLSYCKRHDDVAHGRKRAA